MRDYRDAKTMAQTLRAALSEKNVSLTHAESLELVSKAFGTKDWNTLSAQIQAAQPPSRTGSKRKKAAAKPPGEKFSLPVVLLRDVVVFPHMTLPITAGRERTIRAVERAMQFDGRVLLVTQRVPAEEHPSFEGVYKVGVVGTVLSSATSSEGWLMSFVRGHQRAEIVRFAERDDFHLADIAKLEDDDADAERTKILSQKLLQEIPTYAKAHDGDESFWLVRMPYPSDLARLADAIAARLPMSLVEKQNLLETVNVASRIERLLALMKQGRQAA